MCFFIQLSHCINIGLSFRRTVLCSLNKSGQVNSWTTELRYFWGVGSFNEAKELGRLFSVEELKFDRVSLVRYLPRDGSCIQILIGLEAALLSSEQSGLGQTFSSFALGSAHEKSDV